MGYSAKKVRELLAYKDAGHKLDLAKKDARIANLEQTVRDLEFNAKEGEYREKVKTRALELMEKQLTCMTCSFARDCHPDRENNCRRLRPEYLSIRIKAYIDQAEAEIGKGN